MVTSRRSKISAAAVLLLAISCSQGVSGSAPTDDAAPRAAASAFVRVNQVGYDAAHIKRAYLLSSIEVTGTTFDVVTGGGAIAATRPVGKDLGAWSTRFPHVYALRFDDVTDPGTYNIVLGLPATVSSPPFDIGPPADLFAPLLENARTFYRAQRDGPDVIGSVLDRQPAHLNDANARVFRRAHYTPAFTIRDPEPVPEAPRHDVTGGWFDAGDYIKGIQTESYTAAMLLVARRDFPALLGSGTPADFTAELRFELKWLLKMWNDESRTLFYQVGFGDGSRRYAGDHDPWRLPQEDDTFGGTDPYYRYIRHRPLFRAGPPGSPVSPNLAGRLAAAFGLCSQIFRADDAAFADRCLLAGQHIFDLADTHPARLLTFSPFAYYPESEWHSDLELGAIELFRATDTVGLPDDLPHANPGHYLRKSARWADAYVHGDELGDSLNLYDVSALAHAELARAIDDTGLSNLVVDRGQLVGNIERQLEQAAAHAATEPFGSGFPYAAYDGTSHAQGLAITASLHAELTGSDEWRAFGRRQLDVILGANPWGTSFIVGAGDTFPHCPHHQVANLVGALDGSSPILLGAAVNGTNSKNQFAYLGLPEDARRCPSGGGDRFARFNGMHARWWDNAKSWPTSEPAIDFAATTPLAFAMMMA